MRYWYMMLCLLLAVAAHATKSRYAYVGKIGTLPVQMNLRIDGQELSGEYYYESVGKTIQFEGTLGKNRAVTLYEFGEDPLRTNFSSDKRSGHRFTGKLSASDLELTGTWISANGKRQYPFALNAVATYTVIERTWKGGDFYGCYPAFVNATPELRKLEYQYREAILDSLADLRQTVQDNPPKTRNELDQPHIESVDYQLAYYSADLIAIQQVAGMQEMGAIQPSIVNVTYNYRLHDGKLAKLSLRDLFKPGADYQAKLTDYCRTDLKRQQAPWLDEVDVELDAFTIGPAGLTFIFDPYVSGSWYVLVPYAAIRDLMNRQGPLGRFVREAPG